jgi:hypothetical protein
VAMAEAMAVAMAEAVARRRQSSPAAPVADAMAVATPSPKFLLESTQGHSSLY